MPGNMRMQGSVSPWLFPGDLRILPKGKGFVRLDLCY